MVKRFLLVVLYCTVLPGSGLVAQTTTPLQVTSSDPSSTTFQYDNDTAFAVSYSSYALSVVSYGNPNSGGIQNFTNNSGGNIVLTEGSTTAWTRVLEVLSSGENNGSGNGGTAGYVNAYNYAPVQASGNFSIGLSMFSVQSLGGSGSGSSGQGGGVSGDVVVNNFGSISAGNNSYGIQGASGFRIIDAFSQGGNAGEGEDGYDGSAAGNVTVNNQANLSAYWQATNTSGNPTVYGIFGGSYGGAGGAVGSDADSGKDGGAGGAAGEVNITQQNSDIILSGDLGTSSPLISGAAIAALSIGGGGGTAGTGDNGDPSYAGNGGISTAGTQSTVTITNSNITVSGDYLGGILAKNIGGNGGDGGPDNDHSYAGNGGTSGDMQVTFTNNNAGSYRLSTQGVSATAIEAGNIGGIGGYTNEYTPDTGGVVGNGGNGAGAGWTQVTLNGPLTLSTNGDNSIGVLAYSIGGSGGGAGELSAVGSTGTAGNGGSGGIAGYVEVTLNGVSLSTAGTGSHGVVGLSTAGNGGTGGNFKGLFVGDAGNGGAGGSSGYIQMTVDSASSITTTGDESIGLVGQSLSGSGGVGGARIQGEGSDGAGGAGGSTGTITLTNNGSISTQGLSSYGMFAQGSSGAGGASGYTSSIIYSTNQQGASSGAVGAISLTNTGTISTQGNGSYGIFGQSLSGGGGAGGASYSLAGALGGDGGQAASAGSITFNHSGSTTTYGDLTHGILLQSIGGGGGDGGSSNGVVSIGGSGAGGGAGGGVFGTLTGGSLLTYGNQSHAYLAQSVGGGGGNAGNATSTSAEGSISIGGTGGAGGNGNTVSVTSSAFITTLSTKSIGIVAQSIGGGGGNGGSGYSLDVGFEISAAVAIGGSGGIAGNGGDVTVTTNGGTIWTGQFATPTTPINTLPVDAFGIVAQSIGGGGGNGGSAWAEAVAIGLPSEQGTEYAAALAYAQGGTGGAGGYASGAVVGGVTYGNGVSVNVGNGTQIITQGQGAHAVVAQAVGGGGGNGGDSSAFAATIEYSRAADWVSDDQNSTDTYSATVTVTMGGDGGASSPGGKAVVTLGDSSGIETNITTYGDYANGILVQSIGGGGGNAGVGSGTTEGFGSSKGVTGTLTLGSKGSSGGDGGIATGTMESNGVITTFGSGAHGMVVQSVGGGGGSSQGGMIGAGANYTTGEVLGSIKIAPAGHLTVNLGAQGGMGGSGGTATANLNGTVQTYSSDAIGAIVQSIGGGGGLAGASGADASADNPFIVGLEKVRAFGTAVQEGYVPISGSSTLTLGSLNPGASGIGGTVVVNQSGSISTQGDWSHGVVAQSIGGGGGKAGSAITTGIGAPMSIGLTLGGTGAGGNGGTVTMNLSGGQITTGTTDGTSGFSAFGLVLQSIGGGGGIASDGSDSASGTITVGNGGAATSGNGEAVTLSGTGTIVTYGQAAHGMVLQSIGGGGGIGGAGSSAADQPSTEITYTVGGNPDSSGTGGTVTVQDAQLVIQTSGDNAMGILAQSIGGGGGLAAVVGSTEPDSYIYGVYGQENAAAVNISLSSGSQISTSGFDAYGILAQSIGGGGGVAGYASAGVQTSLGNYFGEAASGYGSTVTVTLDSGASIQTSGAYAHGIFAQSVGNGGGLLYRGFGGSILYAGSVANSGTGQGGAVNITVNGTVNVTGTGAYGILAQSIQAGNGDASDVSITVGGSVISADTAIYVSQGSSNVVTINTGGLVQAPTAFVQDSPVDGVLTVNNYGTASGSVGGYVVINTEQATNAQAVTLNNYGRFFAGPSVQADVMNAGFLEIGRLSNQAGFNASNVSGNLVQGSGGVLVVDADFNSAQSDVLNVQGDVSLGGFVLPRLTSILPNTELPILVAQGNIQGGLAVDNSGETGGSQIFDYDVIRRGNQFNLVATGADFSPAGLNLSPNQQSVADYLGTIFLAGGNPDFGKIFSALDALSVEGAAAYANALNELSPGAALAFGSRASSNAVNFGNQVLNGPVFVGDTATPSEVQSSWARMYGRTAANTVPGGFSDYTANNTLWQVGGQWETSPDWYVGGSLGYQYDWMNSDNGMVSGDGHTGLAAVMVKHERGPWLFSGAITGSAGWQQTERQITIPGFQSQAHGSPTVQSVGAILRAAYTFTQEGWYARPMLTTNLIYARSGSYTENGAGPLNLAVQSADQTNFIATPGFEIGARTDLNCGMVLRSYLVGGVSFATEDSWSQNARFSGAPVTAGDFTTVLPQDDITGRVTAGWQLQTSPRTSIFVQYEGEFSENVIGNGGAFGVKFEF